jgi:hypothetical protein
MLRSFVREESLHDRDRQHPANAHTCHSNVQNSEMTNQIHPLKRTKKNDPSKPKNLGKIYRLNSLLPCECFFKFLSSKKRGKFHSRFTCSGYHALVAERIDKKTTGSDSVCCVSSLIVSFERCRTARRGTITRLACCSKNGCVCGCVHPDFNIFFGLTRVHGWSAGWWVLRRWRRRLLATDSTPHRRHGRR